MAETLQRHRRILIVDDNHDAANSLETVLQLAGHETRTAYGAEEAIEAAIAFKPHFVLLDIGLPRMDGYEVARRIRAAIPTMRLIALTGYGQKEDKQRSAVAGFEAHLVKPVDVTALEKLLATELAS
ncbi:MAG: response regulator [Sulfurifustaceae bacterium]